MISVADTRTHAVCCSLSWGVFTIAMSVYTTSWTVLTVFVHAGFQTLGKSTGSALVTMSFVDRTAATRTTRFARVLATLSYRSLQTNRTMSLGLYSHDIIHLWRAPLQQLTRSVGARYLISQNNWFPVSLIILLLFLPCFRNSIWQSYYWSYKIRIAYLVVTKQ